jgi:site-specific recombinase XerC
MVGDTGLEPVTFAMSTPTPKLKGLTNTNMRILSQSYLIDRSNTRGLTEASVATIKYHFKALLGFCPNKFPTSDDMIEFLGTKTPGLRRRMFETFRAFARWLKKRGIMQEPWADIDIPKVPIPLLKAPSPDNVTDLFSYIDTHQSPSIALRDKTIIATFIESGLRLFELSSIRPEDIDWQERTIRVWGKGRKEGKAPFGQTSDSLLKQWLSQYNPDKGNIWGINKAGITVMLRRLKTATGITCNPHSFRRAFACLLRKAGVDTMTIKDLGRWESLEMVQRYTRSVTFQDSLRFYKAPLS